MKIKQLTQKSLYVALPAILALSAPMTAQATNGYFAAGYGTKSNAMAGAGVANPEDAIAAATNPAGMAFVGNRVDFGIQSFQPNRTAATRNNGTQYNGDGDATFWIPEFGLNYEVGTNMTFGVTVYGNGGMNTKYASIPEYAGASGFRTGVDLQQLFIAPTFAIKLGQKHALGVSLNIINQRFKATGLGGFCGFKASCSDATGATADSRDGLTDQGYDESQGYSVKLGYTGKLTDSFSIGASYQSKADMDKFSKYDELFAEQGDFDIPSTYTVGVSYSPVKSLALMLDYQKINYTDVASISNPNGTGAGTGALGTDNGRGFGWDDMSIIKFGAAYQASQDVMVRFGYSKGDQPIGTDDTAFNLIAPAVIEEHITLGTSFTLASKSELSLFYMHAVNNGVIGEDNVAGQSGAADLQMNQDAFGMAYGWKF